MHLEKLSGYTVFHEPKKEKANKKKKERKKKEKKKEKSHPIVNET